VNKRKRVADQKHRAKAKKMDERRKAAGVTGGVAAPVARATRPAARPAPAAAGADGARRAAPRRRTGGSDS